MFKTERNKGLFREVFYIYFLIICLEGREGRSMNLMHSTKDCRLIYKEKLKPTEINLKSTIEFLMFCMKNMVYLINWRENHLNYV